MHTRIRCNACDHEGELNTLLSAVNPFDVTDTINGCPVCLQCTEGFTALCDEPTCHQAATCGWPSKHGYRNTCGPHWNKKDMTG